MSSMDAFDAMGAICVMGAIFGAFGAIGTIFVIGAIFGAILGTFGGIGAICVMGAKSGYLSLIILISLPLVVSQCLYTIL